MTNPIEPNHSAFGSNDEAGYPHGKGSLSQDQIVLIDEVVADPHVPAFDFAVVDNKETSVYEGIVGDHEVAGLAYNVAGDSRLVLLAVSVFPEFRRQGIGTELIRRVLDDVRAQGKTVTIMCPIVLTFIENHPVYADLIDLKHPGISKGHTRSS
ncbi:GNAT family N-acetyltransferase [Streptomyces sp. NPDC101149]|uniref:GNAT family N-acetyltransferase n=1 Tax=Streptomyces sp. NPDC101149 TaxID=3366113 RepID=UPI00382E99DD